MVIVSERLVRLIRTSTGPRYVVQVPEPVCPIPGWRSYSLLALTHGGDPVSHGETWFRMLERPA